MTVNVLSAGWQVTVEAESRGWYPFVGDRSVVIGAIVEIVGADLNEAPLRSRRPTPNSASGRSR